jgi:putative MATE family efflux protein
MDTYRRLFAIALPIIAQQFVTASLNLVSGLMIGQLGEVAVASVGLSNQVYFLMTLLTFGICSGAAIFTAQLWGKGDVPNVRRVMGLSLIMSLLGAFIFFSLAVFLPRQVLNVYTIDPAVIDLGSQYLRIAGWSYLPTALSFSLSSTLRSAGFVRVPLLVSISALSINTALAYGLIFGNFGLPEMGVAGAAVSIVIARVLECLGLFAVIWLRKLPLAGTPRQLWSFDLPFARAVLTRALPVAANEMLWSLGITTYNIIYARIGTQAVAAVNITSSIENLAFVFFLGISDATAILVGQQIGAGEDDTAYHTARNSLILGIGGALVMGLLLYLLSGLILTLYKVSPEVIDYARGILIVICCTLWLRVSNLTLFIGIFRSGGDTRFAFLLDALGVWLVGVPAAVIGAFVLHLPVYWVYLMVMAEEAAKWGFALRRFFTRRWMHNVTHTI